MQIMKFVYDRLGNWELLFEQEQNIINMFGNGRLNVINQRLEVGRVGRR